MRRQESLFRFRAVVGALAATLGALALWIMVAELVSPRLVYFPANREEAEALYAARGSAATAAEVGVIRGDLWTTAAMTEAAPLLLRASGSSPGQASPGEIEKMRTTAARGARLSPHDSRAWLLLAGLDIRLGDNNPKTAEILKLSYYTGPNEFPLASLRLLLATQSNAISDEELQSLVALEIRRIIAQRPDLKPAIALAYKNARPKGREVIEATLEEADPDFLVRINTPLRTHNPSIAD
jgi:hypothetical protein